MLPLLRPTDIARIAVAAPAGAPSPAGAVLREGIDDHGSVAWSLHADGTVTVRSLHSGRALPPLRVDPDAAPTAAAFADRDGAVAFGFADGSVMTGTLDFDTGYLDADDVPDSLHAMAVGETRVWDGGIVELTPEGQFRRQVLRLEHDEHLPIGTGPILHLDMVKTSDGYLTVAVDSTFTLLDRRLSWKTNMLTGERRLRSRGGSIDLREAGLEPGTPLLRVLVDDVGNLVMLVQADGTTTLLRRNPDGDLEPAGRQDLTPEPGVQVTALAFLGGRVSLAVGDDAGGVTVWFSVPDAHDGPALLRPVHRLERAPAAVTALGASHRSRILAAGCADGTVRLYHVTAQRLLGSGRQGGGAVHAVTIAPREDLILAAAAGGDGLWRIDAPYPETNWHTLMQPVWYEGYPGPAYVWQSSAADDTFEPKLSLVPLIYGTLKATFYSLLFGLPIALLAAAHTSEFLHRNVRARIKPVIETMASLPSVVLGFLAALVLAPIVEDVVVEVVTVIVGLPFAVLLGAHLWQLLPRETALRAERLRPVAVFAAMAAGAAVLWRFGPVLERLGFGGDIKAWLDGRVGGGVMGWFILLLPAAAVFTAWANVRWGEGLLRARGRGWTPLRLAALDLLRFLVSSAVAVLLALFAGWLLDGVGWDPRGSVFGTYVQRNALIVGIGMGFAVIPIIYSIAEDALTAVPDHLRAASLGAGATPWQTLVRVVVPPAMSGLFSAAMIGLGRAVGETMIVLMAAGNTPIMQMNIFNGFRTLSANLAVELPEAVQNSTHYRTLFLAALTLFAMTFVLNTVAEAVRLHFRKKASRL
ncbi:MAG TPA: ABC transporter permease subunit [Candidatus Krumholzibacteria bacterium]|nr:ABC transporter permease subunit [Candidatus Krumholzibacteria bacterium]